MKRLKRMLPLVLALALLVLCAPAAQADYSYKSRIFTGNQGTINGADMVDNATSFDVDDVDVSSDKYYAIGIRESGKGDAKIYTYLPTDVTHDTDYVVVYGLKNDAVTLTIRYVDANGKVLLPAKTVYGNVGDKPQVQAAYYENYTPTYRFITGTLKGDEVWTFEYRQNQAANPANNANAANNANVGNNANAGNNVNAGNNANAGGNGAPTAQLPAATPATPEPTGAPKEILDLDVPLAPSSGSHTSDTPQDGGTGRGFAFKALLILTGILMLALIAVLYWYLLFYRKKRRWDEEADGFDAYESDE